MKVRSMIEILAMHHRESIQLLLDNWTGNIVVKIDKRRERFLVAACLFQFDLCKTRVWNRFRCRWMSVQQWAVQYAPARKSLSAYYFKAPRWTI